MDCLILVGMQYMLHGGNGSFGVGTCRVYTFLPAALRDLRPSGTPSFVARRKIEEKGVPRGCGPLESPELMLTVMPDVLCAYVFATVRLTRLSRLRCREANTLGVRDAYPLASACCVA